MGSRPRSRAHDLALLFGPRHPSESVELRREGVVDLEEALDIGSGVLLLRRLQWPFEPVGESIALGQLPAEVTFVERRKRRGGHSEKAGCDLRVEQTARHGTGGEFEYLEVLRRSVEHGESVGVHERPQWGEVDSERVDQNEFTRPRDLDQCDLGPVRTFAVELRVERVSGLIEQLLDDPREFSFGVDKTMRSHGFRRRSVMRRHAFHVERRPTRSPSRALPPVGERAGSWPAGRSRSLEAA